jgi:pilus assembly protein CpaB
MRLSSILTFALAILFGSAAVFMAQNYLEGQASMANRAPEVAAPAVKTKTIVVAAQPMRFGTEIRPEHLREAQWSEGALPSGSFESISEFLGDGRRVVLSPIEATEPVLSWKVTGPGERATLSAVVEDGMRAMSVRINDILGVAGFVLPGDRVDIMLTRDNYIDVLLQNIKVLAIDQTADERSDQPTLGKTATVEVDSVAAQKLTLAQTVGTLSFALRSAGSVDAASPRRINVADLGPDLEIYADAQDEDAAESPVDLLARNVESGFRAIESRISEMGAEFSNSLKTEAVPFDPNARVGIIRGTKREEYTVPRTDAEEAASAAELASSDGG